MRKPVLVCTTKNCGYLIIEAKNYARQINKEQEWFEWCLDLRAIVFMSGGIPTTMIKKTDFNKFLKSCGGNT